MAVVDAASTDCRPFRNISQCQCIRGIDPANRCRSSISLVGAYRTVIPFLIGTNGAWGRGCGEITLPREWQPIFSSISRLAPITLTNVHREFDAASRFIAPTTATDCVEFRVQLARSTGASLRTPRLVVGGYLYSDSCGTDGSGAVVAVFGYTI